MIRIGKYWFTADTHFDHSKIIEYCKRPFKSINHMNMELIRKWNKKVKPGDTIFHLGDFCFKGGKQGGKLGRSFFEKQLNGKIILIKGNHDNNNSIIEDMIIRHGGKYFHLVHNPEEAESEYNLVGHIHDKWLIKKSKNKILINVGVDVWDFYPISINQINELIDKFMKEKEKD